MPIRMIAQELYRLLQEVEKVEKEFKNAPFEKHEEIKDQLRKLKAERNRVQAILEGKKEHKPNRSTRQTNRPSVEKLSGIGV